MHPGIDCFAVTESRKLFHCLTGIQSTIYTQNSGQNSVTFTADKTR